MSRLPLTTDEQRLLLMARPLQAILRPGFRGRPFRLAGEITGSQRSETRFDEALVLAMVARGLLTVTQVAKDLPVHGQPGVTYDCPFSCILSKVGVEQRAYLIADHRRPAANDSDSQERAA